MEPKAVDADAIFKVFTACPKDPRTLLLDVREQKHFKKGHINQAFNPRLATNGKFLADYSGAQYSLPFSQDCWWGKPVVVYGPPSLSKEHPVIKFLAEQQRCASLSYFKQGYEAFEAKFPFLCTTSVKANSYKKYPSLILPGFLYLGDWGDAEQLERLKELKIKRIVSIHNHPERLKPAPGIRHMRIELPDIGTADISAHFNSVFEFLSEAERLKQPVLVHCGAGVSRSACLCMMYLMRSKRWSAQQARDHCIAARSLVCPNDGFWRVLCALEGPLGITNRSDPNATQGFAGADAPAVKLDEQAAGQPVQVRMLSAKEVKQAEEAASKAAAMAAAAAAMAAQAQQQQAADRTGRKRSRSPDGQRSSRRKSSSSSSSDSSSSDSDSGGRSRSRSRDRQHNGAAAAAGARKRSHSHSPHKRRRHSRSRSPGRHREVAVAAGGPADAAARAAVDAEAAALAAAPPPQQQSGWLVKLEVSKPEGVVGQLLLGPMDIHQRVVFGRAPQCDVVLEHLSVSRQHAQLTVDLTGSVCIMDLGAQHGTKLQDTWLKPQQQRSMAVGSSVQFGASTRRYKLLEVHKL